MTRPIQLACILACLLALPCCKDRETGQESTAAQVERPALLKQPSKADRQFLTKLQNLPKTKEEKEVERWTSLGITVESGWVVEMDADKLVIEHTDISKEELARHYHDKLENSGWTQTSHDEGDGQLVYELERGGVTVSVTGKDREEGGATVILLQSTSQAGD